MRYVILALVILLSHYAHSQCNIQEEKTSEFYKIHATPEYLFKNEDLENGVQVVTGNVSYLVNVTNIKDYAPVLTIKYGYSGEKPELVPREVQLRMSNNNTIYCKAKTMSTESKKGFKINICTFVLLQHELNALKTSTIESVTVVDTRTGASVKAKPYHSLFKEQLECVESSYSLIK